MGERHAPAAPERRHPFQAPLAAYAAAASIFFLTVAFAQSVSPLGAAAPSAFDTASTVLYFDHLVSGRVLEAFVPTTPKPLLTVVYGPLWLLTHDWRVLTWAAVAAFASANAFATILGWRVAGPAAGVFAGVAMASSSLLMWEALRGLATPWATLGWIIAALAVTARPPRWGLAGLALAIGTLARVETLAIVGAAAVALLVLSAGPRRFRQPVPRRAWLLLLGLMAIPIMLAHDWLLVRDPFYWARVSGIYSESQHVSSGIAGLGRVVATFRSVFRPIVAIGILSVGGMVVLARRSPMLAYGGASLVVGVAGFTLYGGYVGYVIPDRYEAPIVVTVIISAGMAVGVAVELLATRLRARGWVVPAGAPRVVAWGLPAAAVAVVGLSALLLSGRVAPLDHRLRDAALKRGLVNQDASSMSDAIRSALADPSMASAAPPRVVVPQSVRPLLAVELGLDLKDLVPLPAPSLVDVAAGSPASGSLVLYLRSADPSGAAAELAADTTIALGSVTLVPVVADTVRGRWLVRLERQN